MPNFDDPYAGGMEMPFDLPYDAEGGHTREEAEAEYAKLFRELHGDDGVSLEIPEKRGRVFIMGHVNPDTDTIVASMAYAHLKNQLNDGYEYVPVRAGKVNEETDFVLNEVGLEPPEFLSSAGTQIMDIDIRELSGLSHTATLKAAWGLLKERGLVTIPITTKKDDGNEELNGLVTIQDIGNIYMDEADHDLLAQADTPYANVIEALDGQLVLDNKEHKIAHGKIVVGSGDFEMISGFVREGDIVILANRSESHKAAIEAGASLLIATMGTTIDDAIIELAKAHNCAIIVTGHDTYTAARLMNQSIPVRYAMAKDKLVTFKTTDYLDDVKKVMSKKKYRDFPVLDEDGNYVGMISRRFLVDTARKKVILVDHNEKSQAIEDIGEAEILEIIDHHRLSSVETIEPVYFRNEPVGSTSTIVYEMYKESGIMVDKSHAHLLCAGILSDTLMFKSPTTSQRDKMAAIDLASTAGIDMTDFSASMFRAGSEVGDKDGQELIGQDFKRFTIDGINVGISQINSMDKDELLEIKSKVDGLLDEQRKTRNLDMIFFMLTDIVAGQTDILFAGKEAKDVLETAFELEVLDDVLTVPGLISRKKQMVPEIIGAMQQ
jgi:manganese-dependent inorganic pyrophosphatase